MTERYAIGMDIGGTKCAVVLGRQHGEHALTMVDRLTFDTTSAPTPAEALPRLCAMARELLARHAVAQWDGVGVSCGGPLNSAAGIILSPPNLPGWDAVPIVEYLTRALRVRVRLQNDANAGALAEWRYGAGQGTRHLIFCTCGTGFGAGLILNGRLYAGSNDMAGEIGHVRLAPDGPVGYGKRGSVEGFCSGGGIAQLARQYIRAQWQQGKTVAFCATPDDLARISARDVGLAAHAGDPLAQAIYREVGARLGQTLAVLVDLFNPEVIVIGGIFPRMHELLWPQASRVLGEEALPLSLGACRVLPAALGEAIGDYASLAVAFSED
jgi:glucokinase